MLILGTSVISCLGRRNQCPESAPTPLTAVKTKKGDLYDHRVNYQSRQQKRTAGGHGASFEKHKDRGLCILDVGRGASVVSMLAVEAIEPTV